MARNEKQNEGTFNCGGKININDWSLKDGSMFEQKEVEFFLEPSVIDQYSMSIFGFNNVQGCTLIMNLRHYIKCMEMTLNILSRFENIETFGHESQDKDVNFYSLRRSICYFLVQLRNYIESIKLEYYSLRDISEQSEIDFGDLLKTILKFLKRFKYIPDATFHYAMSNSGNRTLQAEYHYYHLHLDLRWLVVTLTKTRKLRWQNPDQTYEDVEQILLMIINDLVYVASKLFSSLTGVEIITKTPFNCTCVRELWLMIQFITDELSNSGKLKPFWDLVNQILNILLNPEKISNQDFEKNISIPHLKNIEIFCLWMVYHLTLLYGFNKSGIYQGITSNRVRPNTEQIEKILKNYVNNGGKDGTRNDVDDELQSLIPMLYTLNKNWSLSKPNVAVVTFLWECFHRRLDEIFLIQTRGPWKVSYEKKSPTDILDSVKSRLKSENELINMSSFAMFLHFLGNILKQDPKFWKQLQGRIYSRFSDKKVAELTENGIFNFISLFFTLAVTVEKSNTCLQMLSLLPKDIEKTDSRKILIWKSKLAALLLYCEQNHSFENIAPSFIERINTLCCENSDSSKTMMSSFIDVFKVIMLHGENFSHHQYLFIEGWIDRYLTHFPSSKTLLLMDTLIRTFEKCNELSSISGSGSVTLLEKLWQHVASRTRQMITCTECDEESFKCISKMATLFTLNALKNPALGKTYGHSLLKMFQHFTTSLIIKEPRIPLNYLTLLLKNETAVERLKIEIPNFNLICIQTWIKCSILNQLNREDFEIVLNYIIQTDDLKDIFKIEIEKMEIITSDKPIITMFKCISRRLKVIKPGEEKIRFENQIRSFLQNIDKWILLKIDENTKDKIHASWTYACVGNLLCHCSAILYNKNQPNNIFRSLLLKMVIPSDSSHYYLHQLGRGIFREVILAFDKLDVKNDNILKTYIAEIFEQYLPLVIKYENVEGTLVISSVFLDLFKDTEKQIYCCCILNILTSKFITVINENQTHNHCYLVMFLMKTLLKGGPIYPAPTIKYILQTVTQPVINCYMKVRDLHPHRTQTIEYITEIVKNIYFLRDYAIREDFQKLLWPTLKPNVQYNIQIIHELLLSMKNISPNLVQYLHANIDKYINEILDKRIQSRLRYSFDIFTKNHMSK